MRRLRSLPDIVGGEKDDISKCVEYFMCTIEGTFLNNNIRAESQHKLPEQT